jgi:HD-GYP domain-containing protein (c-di-GMP phosphodiesterase class II)
MTDKSSTDKPHTDKDTNAPYAPTEVLQAPNMFAAEAPSKGRKAKLQQLGRQAIGTLYMLIRNVRMYDADNAIFAQPLEQLREVINTVIAVDGKFDLAAAGTVLSLNGTVITVDFSSLENVRALTNEMKARDMGGMLAARPVQLAELKAFLRAFSAQDANLEAVEGLVNVKVGKYRAIVEQLHKRSESEIQQHRKIDRQKYAFTVYARAVTYMKRFGDAVASGKDELPSMAPAVRLVRDFVDICQEQRQEQKGGDPHRARNVFLGMTVARQAHDYLAYHSVNTCLMSIVVGSELGLSREQLFDLGRAALFHDVGAAGNDPAILNKTGALTRQERTVVAQSPLIGAKMMLKARPLDLGALRCILAAAEAKQPYFRIEIDPATNKSRWHLQALGLFGRIIRICSTYDALTSARPYREAFPPEIAIAMMCSQMKHEFDPHLLSTFVKILSGATLQAAPASSFTVA